MLLDAHVHTVYGKTDMAYIKKEMARSGIEGAALFSHNPGTLASNDGYTAEERLKEVLRLTKGEERL